LRHAIVVENAVSLATCASKAECLAGARACPPEDCGGAYGYAELLEALLRGGVKSATAELRAG